MPAPLTRAILFIEELRKLDPMLPMQYALGFLVIARQEGMTQQKLADAVGVSKSGAERIFARLSEKGLFQKEGLRLIEVREGEDRRERRAYLTAKGRRFINAILHFMEG